MPPPDLAVRPASALMYGGIYPPAPPPPPPVIEYYIQDCSFCPWTVVATTKMRLSFLDAYK